MHRGWRWALAAVVTLAPGVARGQGNVRSTPIGGRSALLGGTGVALGRDGAAPFLNPATIVRIQDQKLAFSVNFYSLDILSLGQWHQPGPVDASRFGGLTLKDTTLSYTSFEILPSTLCVFLTVAGFGEDEPSRPSTGQAASSSASPTALAAPSDVAPAAKRTGRQKLAACLANVERDELTFTADAFASTSGPLVAHQTGSLLRRWNRIAVGPTYAIDLSEHLSLGASLHGVVSTHRSVWSMSSVTYDPAGLSVTSSFNKAMRGTSIDLAAILGATFRAGVNTFGIALHTPGLHVYGTASSTYHVQYAGAGEGGALGSGEGSYIAPPAPRLALAWGRELNRGLVEANVGYTFPQQPSVQARLTGREVTVTDGRATERPVDTFVLERLGGAFNGALGGEYYLSPRLSVLAGIGLDMTAQPPLVAAATSLGAFSQARVSRASFSAGLGSHGTGGELLVGTSVTYGWGSLFAVNPYQLPPSFTVIDHTSFGVLLVVAGTTSLRVLKKAVDNVGDIVAPSK